jgi:hypothetical protein
MKNSNDTIGNRTCDLPTCSAVSQPATPPRVPHKMQVSVFTAVRTSNLTFDEIFLLTRGERSYV